MLKEIERISDDYGLVASSKLLWQDIIPKIIGQARRDAEHNRCLKDLFESYPEERKYLITYIHVYV